MRSDLGRRLGVAAVGIPIGVGIIYIGGWVFVSVAALLAVGGTLEVYGLSGKKGRRPFPWLGVPVAAGLVAWAFVAGSVAAWSPVAVAALLVVAFAALAAGVFRRGADGDPLSAAGTTVLGVMYAAVPMAFAVFLRELPEVGGGMGWAPALLAMFPFVVTWLADTAAYGIGTRFGKRKLMPAVSPAKTVEGSVAGMVAAVLGAVLYVVLFLDHGSALAVTPAWAAGAGLLIGAAAQVGDLAESVLKREAGVKDSGAILPGHGGVLDRFDGVYFTLPLTYAMVALLT